MVATTNKRSEPKTTATEAPGRVAPSSLWSRAMVTGPDPACRITEGYARLVARNAYFWAWPMVNIYNRRLAFDQCPEPGLMNGVLPFAPLNTMSMLHDYIQPEQRWVACPNQDVVYGAGITALDRSPVVVQVPDFAGRFWVYQVVDLRTDSYAQIGAMYGTPPGFYLLVGPAWNSEVPKGIAKVFRSRTSTGFVAPRVFQDDSPEDKQAVKSVIRGIDVYALDKFDGTMKQRDWTTLPRFAPPGGDGGEGESAWVFPETFFDQLPAVLDDAPPLPGEEALYAQILAVIDAASRDPSLKQAMIEEAAAVEKETISPLLQFRSWGVQLPNHWSAVSNPARFGTDYFARTAVARSNILVNAPDETKYLYQDLDADGIRLNGAKRYTVTFGKDGTPPAYGFWSLTLYDAHHFFVPNPMKRYSVGTKNKDLKTSPDGSLTIYVQAEPPADAQRSNWLPAPKDQDFSLFIRAYWPRVAVIDGSWTPPPVARAQ